MVRKGAVEWLSNIRRMWDFSGKEYKTKNMADKRRKYKSSIFAFPIRFNWTNGVTEINLKKQSIREFSGKVGTYLSYHKVNFVALWSWPCLNGLSGTALQIEKPWFTRRCVEKLTSQRNWSYVKQSDDPFRLMTFCSQHFVVAFQKRWMENISCNYCSSLSVPYSLLISMTDKIFLS